MAMALQGADGDDDAPMTEMNTTPLIDVMLVLLIMLIITIPIQLHAVDMTMPGGPPRVAPPAPPRVVHIAIADDGALTWDGDAVAGRAAMDLRLAALAREADPPELHLRAERHTAYKHVAAVLASAQRLGLTKVGVVGNERFAAAP